MRTPNSITSSVRRASCCAPGASCSGAPGDLTGATIRHGDNFPVRDQAARSAPLLPPFVVADSGTFGDDTSLFESLGACSAIGQETAAPMRFLTGSIFDSLPSSVDANASAQLARECVLDAGRVEGPSSTPSLRALALDQRMSAVRHVERRNDSNSGPAAGRTLPMRTASVMTEHVRYEVLNELIALTYQADVFVGAASGHHDMTDRCGSEAVSPEALLGDPRLFAQHHLSLANAFGALLTSFGERGTAPIQRLV